MYSQIRNYKIQLKTNNLKTFEIKGILLYHIKCKLSYINTHANRL